MTSRESEAARSRKSRRQDVKELPFDQSVGYQVRMVQKAFVAELQARVEPFGVSAGMWFFLRILWHEDGLTQRELSNRIGLTEPTAVTTVANMESAGLITRIRNETDRRRINVFLTKRGRALREKMLPIAYEVNAKALDGLSASEIQLLLNMLKRMREQLARPS
jgi:MarR family transcriptional regulator, organic hydroperoxide resistance regulator